MIQPNPVGILSRSVLVRGVAEEDKEEEQAELTGRDSIII
jgi:hypothetical protein